MSKVFFTYEQQLDKLEKEKGLIIADRTYAESMLKVSQNYSRVSEFELHQFIRVLASCRNTCAHGERLFTFRIKESGPDTVLHKKMRIPTKNGAYTLGKQDLFAVVIALRYLITNDEFKVFKRNLKAAVGIVLNKCPHISEQQLYGYMGFPSDWDKMTRYKK